MPRRGQERHRGKKNKMWQMPHQNYKSSALESELRQVVKDNDIAVKGARGLGLKHK